MNNKKRLGFTLVELLVVISIIGILSSISTASVNIARQRARDARRQADASQIQLALYLYFDDHLSFPEADMLPENAVSNWTNVLVPNLNGTNGGRKYMTRVPLDPLNIDPHFYGYNSDGKEFIVTYYLENGGPAELHGY
ncbi:MAG: prepilin-type N-terminal cleavage/methylation domain-containing protein [Patescibacteria group bacterium]|nr:prepilin-type N-terminal cleavage/methylation domain-containing protein [Patescibacteria group bacterium]